MPSTPALCPSSTRSDFRVATSQVRTVVSTLADASVLPSGVNERAVTAPECPAIVLMSLAVAQS